MIPITDANRPICEKCNERPAITNVSSIWICGECLIKHIEKEKERKRKIILEE